MKKKSKELQEQLFALQSENENLNEKVNSDFVNGSSNTVDIFKTYCTFGKSQYLIKVKNSELNRQSSAT